MAEISAPAMLAVWDRARADRGNLSRALILLQLLDNSKAEKVDRLTMGQRDSMLLDLRETIFGKEIAALASCSFCNETLEARLLVDDVRVRSPETNDHRIR